MVFVQAASLNDVHNMFCTIIFLMFCLLQRDIFQIAIIQEQTISFAVNKWLLFYYYLLKTSPESLEGANFFQQAKTDVDLRSSNTKIMSN